MKHSTQLITAFLLLAVVFGGVSCRPNKTGTPVDDQTGSSRPLTLYGSEEKDGYAENIAIKLEDLNIHTAKIKERRATIAVNEQKTFDAAVTELEQKLKEFEAAFEAFKQSPLESFLPEREKLNNKLVEAENVFIKIITDYKLEF